ncbi:MAG: hypothetical protein BGO34_08065 [Bacteroidia bacterium 44-10]|nr:MAG: hypothetical protein BGO34_08065 [Bacteroidia bacterium 44-10]
MKKIILFFAIIAGFISCKNEAIDFPDFDYTTGFFPYQYPVRTIILGNYIYDNSNDNNHRFVVSTAMGGVYKNETDRIFNFVVDESLCEDAYFGDGTIMKALPSSYYTLSDPNKIIIPVGKMNGGVEVQLSEAFFNDPLAIKNTYVLPIRITSVTGLDSLLQGATSSPTADRRIAGQWTVVPKDFTMFAVKFVNPYHGSYLMRGKATVTENGVTLGDSIYQSKTGYVEQDEVIFLKTEGRTKVKMGNTFKSNKISGPFELILNFTTDKYDTEGGVACTVEAVAGSSYTVSGTGKYAVDASEFGGKKRDLIELTYTINKDNKVYTATDRLVFRDKGINMETYTVQVIPEI